MTIGFIDPKNVIVALNGKFLTGFAEDNHIEIEPKQADYQEKSGVDGEVVRVRSNDRRATVRIKLQQTSLSNGYLSQLRDDDRLSPLGQTFTLSVEDLNTGSRFTSPQAWIERAPKAGYGVTAQDREWMIVCSSMEIILNGNAT